MKIRLPSKNRSVLHDMLSRKAIWRLLSIMVCAVVLTSLKQSYVENRKSMNYNLIRREKRKSEFKR